MIIPPQRTSDCHGQGHYGAPRGTRKHKGVDLACHKGSKILSLSKGVVTKIGYPYNPSDEKKGHLRYVEVRIDETLFSRYFYVEPIVKVNDVVSELDLIGETQGLCDIYPGITDHYHFELFHLVGGKRHYIDPKEIYDEIT